MPFTMLKRMAVASGAGLVAATVLAKRATRSQDVADAWNRTRLARGVNLGGRRLMLHAPHRVGGRGDRGRWHWQAEVCRPRLRERVRRRLGRPG